MINEIQKHKFQIVTIKDPEPGTWVVTAGADSKLSGLISVISTLLFRYGFTSDEPISISRAPGLPLKGANNYLAISPNDDTLVGNLTSVDVVWEGNELNLLLKRKVVSSTEVLYYTNPFEIPKKGFKFYVS